MTLIFYDWEFQDNGRTIEPISLGMVTELGNELYLVNDDFDWKTTSHWLKQNVQPQLFREDILLPTQDYPYKVRDVAFSRILSDWVPKQIEFTSVTKAQLIGYYADYDHVLLAQQFGTMMQLPNYMPMWTRDLKQWCADLGDPRLPEQGKGEHHALLDARWVRDSYNWLVQNYEHPAWTPRLQKPKLKVSDLI